MYLPYDRPPLSLNDRRNRYQHAREVREVRGSVALVARAARLGRHDHVTVEMHYVPAKPGRRDVDNLVATLKPVCDALVDVGLVLDDDPAHMTKPMPVVEPADPAVAPNRRLWIDITPCPAPTGDPVLVPNDSPAFTEADEAAFARLLTATDHRPPLAPVDIPAVPDVELTVDNPDTDPGDPPPPADEQGDDGDGDDSPMTMVVVSVCRPDGTHVQATAYLSDPPPTGQLARAVRACSVGALAQVADLDSD